MEGHNSTVVEWWSGRIVDIVELWMWQNVDIAEKESGINFIDLYIPSRLSYLGI